MRTAQHERREWIAAAGEPQLIELERREIGQHADGNLANIRAPGAGGGAFGATDGSESAERAVAFAAA